MKQTKQNLIDDLKFAVSSEQANLREQVRGNEILRKEVEFLKKRIAEIAAENESLRMDKKWLQQMHSAVLQSMHAFVSGRRT